MVRTRLLCLVLLAVLLLAGCAGKPQDTPEEEVLPPLPEIPVHEGTSIADSPFVGSFHSSLTCVEDGTFVLAFDSLSEAGTVTVSGTFTVENDTAVCTVKNRTAENYLGSELETFELKVLNEKEVRYRGEQQGLVADRDIFSREG